MFLSKRVNELTKRIAQPNGVPTRAVVDLISAFEGIVKTLVDISGLAPAHLRFLGPKLNLPGVLNGRINSA